MPIDQAVHLYKNIKAISKGQPKYAIITDLKKIEIPIKLGESTQKTTIYA